jgi:hypothetical protein
VERCPFVTAIWLLKRFPGEGRVALEVFVLLRAATVDRLAVKLVLEKHPEVGWPSGGLESRFRKYSITNPEIWARGRL